MRCRGARSTATWSWACRSPPTWTGTLDALKPADVWQGLSKSFVFAAIITLVGATNGFMVKAGAEGVGKATTRSVVVSIASIILADMIFSYFQSR